MDNNKNITDEKSFNKYKWYCSYPVLMITCCFCMPISIVLTIVRFAGIKTQSGSYKVRTIIAVCIQVFLVTCFVGAIAFIVIDDMQWDKEYALYFEDRNYEQAKGMLDKKYMNNLSVDAIERYFDLFEQCRNYQDVDILIEKYYDTLSDKTSFDENVYIMVEEILNELSKEQIENIQTIKVNIEMAKQEKEAQIAEESRAKAESESVRAAEESQAKAESESAREAEELRTKAESEFVRAVEESRAVAESESVKAAEDAKRNVLAESMRAAQNEAREKENKRKGAIKENIQQYKENPKKKYIKNLQKEDAAIVWSVVKECIGESIATHSFNSITCSEILEYCDIYSTVFSGSNGELEQIIDYVQRINTLDDKINKIEKKYSFDIRNKAESIETYQWYVGYRLETHYDDTITDTIRKEIDSYKEKDGSDWVAYNVEYFFGQTYPGDNMVILHSQERNPFSETGEYWMDCILLSSTRNVVDSNGFEKELPVYEIIANREFVMADKRSIVDAEQQINQLWEKIRMLL